MRRFGLTTVRFIPEPWTVRVTIDSAEAAIAALDVPQDQFCFLCASLSEGNVSWGEFELWCSGERARARILEHREHDARYGDSSADVHENVRFRDEDGFVFEVPFDETVPRDLAVAALKSWLKDQNHPAALQWL